MTSCIFRLNSVYQILDYNSNLFIHFCHVGSAPGGDLQTIIDDNLVPFEADVVKFVRQLVEGLVYLHERKVAHLDIKVRHDPQFVFLFSRGAVSINI
jgi:serine/threonine protein kinase